ncbi:hypothetical protein BG004_003590 [Podila humilis]|nr:hypothetical protein BG004_003590 [Podila humilis]
MSSLSTNTTKGLALSIPHICDDIVDQLSSRLDILNAAKVSRAFYAAFSNYIWRDLKITTSSQLLALQDSIQFRSPAGKQQIVSQRQPKIRSLTSNLGETWDMFVVVVVRQFDEPTTTTTTTTTTIEGIKKKDKANNNIPVTGYTLFAPFSNLTTLRAIAPWETDDDSSSIQQQRQRKSNGHYAMQLVSIIHGSSRLQVLEMSHFCNDDKIPVNELAKVIRAHRSLKSVKISMGTISKKLYSVLLWACWNLEQLALIAAHGTQTFVRGHHQATTTEHQEEDNFLAWLAENRPSEITTTTTTTQELDVPKKKDINMVFKMRDLLLDSCNTDHDMDLSLGFLLRCGNLERLKLPQVYTHAEMAELSDFILAGSMPNLVHLDMGNFLNRQETRDRRDARLLSAFAVDTPSSSSSSSSSSRKEGLKAVVVGPSVYSLSLTVDALLNVGATLESITLVGCSLISSRNIHEILTVCSGLKSFVALSERDSRTEVNDPILQAITLEYSHGWTCLGLTSLRLRIESGGMSCGEDRCNRAGISQGLQRNIRELVELRDLRLSWDLEADDHEGFQDAVSMWASESMERALLTEFGALKKLETLELRGMSDYVSNSQLAEAKGQWKNIQWVKCSSC